MNKITPRYVYVLLDPRKPGKFQYKVNETVISLDFEPFYVGKGVRSRMLRHEAHARKFPEPKQHDFKTNKIRSIHREGMNLISVKICEVLTDEEACQFEMALIQAIGRFSDGGPLTNYTLGGEGHCGYRAKESTKERMRSAHASKTSDQKAESTRKRLEKVNLTEVAVKANKTKSQHTPERRAAIQAQRKATIANLGEEARAVRAAKAAESMRERNRLNPPEPVTCPHCGKTGSPRGIKKHHFDRCAMKPLTC